MQDPGVRDYERPGEQADEGIAPDLLTSWLIRVILLLLLVLAGGAVTLVAYVLQIRGAPRNQTERVVKMSEAEVERSPKKVELWVGLAYAYADSGRYPQALNAVERARALKNSSKLDLAEADILRLAKRYPEAVKAYDKAEKTSYSDFKQAMTKLEERGVLYGQVNETAGKVFYGRALTYQSMGQTKKALDDARHAQSIFPLDSNVLTLYGDLLAESGRKKEAITVYKAALRYVPDHKDALAGLKRLEK